MRKLTLDKSDVADGSGVYEGGPSAAGGQIHRRAVLDEVDKVILCEIDMGIDTQCRN